MRARLKTDYWAYWKCEDTAMPIRDSVGLADFVTLLAGGIHSTTGKIGKAFDLGQFPSPILNASLIAKTRVTGRFNFLDHDFTIRVWVNLGVDGFGDTGSFDILSTTSAAVWDLYIQDDLTFTRVPVWRVRKPDLSDYEIVGSTIPQGSWTRLVAWYEHGVEIGLKINDDANVTLAATDGIRNTTPRAVELNSAGATSNCLIDEIAVWDRVLTSSELSADWNSGNGVTF